jgi:hypothetical protein
MNDKTEELRDIFLEVADEGSVTERQEEPKGSLAADEGAVEERLRAVVAEMRETYEFSTPLDDASLVRVVRGYYEGETDAELADALDTDRQTAVRARLDLHLVREADTDAPFEFARLRRLLTEGASVTAIADRLGVAPKTVRRYRRVAKAQQAARQVSDRFRSAFVDALPDADLTTSMTEEMREDGLADATEGMETDTTL